MTIDSCKRAIVVIVALLVGPVAATPQSRIPEGRRWTVENVKDPLTDAVIPTATARVTSTQESGTYELRLRLVNQYGSATQKIVEVTYTIFDAPPLGVQLGLGKSLRVRFDDHEATNAGWVQSREFRNVGKLAIDSLDFEQKRLTQSVATVERRILIQGLRGSDEYLEFVIDSSFESFRGLVRQAIAARPAAEVQQERPRAVAGAPGGSLGDALRNLQQNVRKETFDNSQAQSDDSGPTIQFDTKGVEFAPWLRRFVAQVRRNWLIPQAGMAASGHVVMQFNIHRDGSITDINVQQRSPIQAFNDAAYGAIASSNPTEPLPREYPEDQALFTVTFSYGGDPPR